MKIGVVTGTVTMKNQTRELEDAVILTVDMEENTIVALDKAGAKIGDQVLLAMSHAALRYSMDAPADAVVVGVVNR